MSKRHWLCNDVMGFLQCANCLRNPEHETNKEAALNPYRKRYLPLTSSTGCADQMQAAGYARGTEDA